MATQRRAGIIYFKVDGIRHDAKGNFTYNPGKNKREAVLGADGVHGYKETPQVAFIEGEITDRGDLDLAQLVQLDDSTVTLELNTGKVFVLRNAWFAGDGTANTEESNIAVRFESKDGEEIQ